MVAYSSMFPTIVQAPPPRSRAPERPKRTGGRHPISIRGAALRFERRAKLAVKPLNCQRYGRPADTGRRALAKNIFYEASSSLARFGAFIA